MGHQQRHTQLMRYSRLRSPAEIESHGSMLDHLMMSALETGENQSRDWVTAPLVRLTLVQGAV